MKLKLFKVKMIGFIIRFCLLYLTVMVILCRIGYASDTLSFSLDEAVKLALEHSPSIRQAKYDSIRTAENWTSTRGERYPQIYLNQWVPDWRESINEQLLLDPNSPADSVKYIPTRVPSGDLRWQGQLNVDQKLPWGANLSATSQLYKREWYWTEFDEKQYYKEYSWMNRISFEQPIFSGNPVGREQKIGNIDYNMGQINYELQRRNIIYEVTNLFYNLVQAEGALEISRQDLESGRESEELAKRKLNSGLIPEVELLQIQVELARREGSYFQVKAALESNRENFNLKLGLPIDQLVITEYSDKANQPDMEVNYNSIKERLELKRERLNLERLELQTKASILSERMTATLNAYYELDNRREQFENLDKRGDRNVGITLNFRIPIYGFGTTHGRIQSLRTAIHKAKIELIEREAQLNKELREAIRNVKLARQRIDIANAAVDLSEKSLEITQQRFENGLVSSRELIDSQFELTRTKREALNAQIDFELAVAYLEKIMPESLERP